jgi:rubrerythrin
VFLKDALLRWVTADARRMEAEVIATLRGMLAEDADAHTRALIEEILAEEETHLAHLDELADTTTIPEEPPCAEEVPSRPAMQVSPGPVRKRLEELLTKEEAAASFYDLLAARTPIPAFRDVFGHIAAEEHAHAERLRAHLKS